MRKKTTADYQKKLREEAEVRFAGHPVVTPALRDSATLLHELQVHQIELEMQNDELRRAQVVLEESHARYADLYEFAPVGYLTLAGSGTITMANLIAATQLGVERGQLLGRTFESFVLPAEGPRWRTFLSTIRPDAEPRGTDVKLRRADGAAFDAHIDGQFTKTQGPVSTARLTITDISERCRNEEALRQGDERYRSLLAGTPLGVTFQDVEGRITSANPAAERILGLSLDILQGRTSLDSRWKAIREDGSDFPGVDHPAMVALRTGVTQRSVMGIFNPALERYTWISVSAVPQFDPSQKVVLGVFTTFEDITENQRAERQLERQNSLLGALINSPRDIVIFSLDEDYRYTAFNDKHRQEMRTVWNADIRIGMNLLECMKDFHLRDLAKQSIDRALGGESFSEISYQSDLDIHYEFTWDPIRQPDRSICGVTAFIRNVTERKRAEAESQELLSQVRFEKDRLTALLNSIRDEVWYMGTDGRVVLANQAALREFGARTPHGLDVRVLAESLEVCRADGTVRPPEESPVLRALNGDLVADQEEIVRAPGSGEMRYRQVSSAPVKDAQGTVIGVVSVVRDITDHKRADAERERLALALEQAAETVVITDVQGNITYVNPAFELVTGYSRAEALGQNPRILKSGAQESGFYKALWETITSGRTWRGQMVNRRKDGRNFTEEASISPVRDSAGTIKSFVAVKRDISSELDLKARLLQSQKLESVGRLAGGVAHDFNNLLTVILSAAQDLRDANKEGKPVDTDEIEEIIGAGRRAADLTRQLLAFARKQVITPVAMNLSDAVHSSEKLLRRVIGEDIQIVEQLDPHLGLVMCDPGLFDQVIMNLAVNARDAMKGGGILTLATENAMVGPGEMLPEAGMGPGPYVKLTIMDSGAGMSAEVMAHLFEPFFTTKETGKGTGLGLATVYGILKQSNAFIDVRSTPGHGTTFGIYFPRWDGVQTRPASASPVSSAGTETVLVIEDDASVRQVAVRSLRSGGYRVLEANGGRQALELLRRDVAPLHLILTDVVMPGQSGREVARRITELRPGVRTLYMSGYTRDAISQHGVLDEGLDFLPKPFTSETLLSRVRQSLDRVFSEASS